MADKDNHKLPKDAISEGDVDPTYGYISGEWDKCGGHVLHYRNPEEHEKVFSQKLFPSGAYETQQHDTKKKQITTSLNPGEHRRYVAGGDSSHSDGHYDLFGEAMGLMQFGADLGMVAKNNNYHGVGGKIISIAKEGVLHGTSGGSEADKKYVVNGSEVKTIDKNKFETVRGETVKTHEKNHLVINQKDFAQYNENWDTYAKSQGRIKTGQKMLIDSDTEIELTATSKITIKVGQSTITVSSSGIEIKGTQITIDGTTTDIKGHPITMNGGGMAAPPFTVP